MRKVFFGLFVLSLMAIGFFLGTISADNKAYALMGGSAGQIDIISIPDVPYSTRSTPNRWAHSEIARLREELDAYKTLEAYWATEAITFANSVQGQWIREINNRERGSVGSHEEGM